jgi:hypothetical protein
LIGHQVVVKLQRGGMPASDAEQMREALGRVTPRLS